MKKDDRKAKNPYDTFDNIPNIMLNEFSDLRERIMFSLLMEEKKKNRIIEKWNALDDQCGRRGIKVPFDA
jgi:hypothetical protein